MNQKKKQNPNQLQDGNERREGLVWGFLRSFEMRQTDWERDWERFHRTGLVCWTLATQLGTSDQEKKFKDY